MDILKDLGFQSGTLPFIKTFLEQTTRKYLSFSPTVLNYKCPSRQHSGLGKSLDIIKITSHCKYN